jgi:hypothetical protein
VVLEVTTNYLDKRYYNYSSGNMKKIKIKIDALTKKLKSLKSPIKPIVDKHTAELEDLHKKYLICYKLILIRKKVIISNPTVCEVLKFVQFIPYNAIVMNDLTEEYISLSKKEKDVFKSILNKGRHFGITLIMLIHTWNGFGTDIRNSAHNIIFTVSSLATTFAEGQKLKGAERRVFDDAIEAIITRDRALPDDQRKYTCVLFDRHQLKYSYIQADPKGKQIYVGVPYFTKTRLR